MIGRGRGLAERVRNFVEDCRQGRADLPTRGGRPNYTAISRALFGTASLRKPEYRYLREPIEAFHAEQTTAKEARMRSAVLVAASGSSRAQRRPPAEKRAAIGDPVQRLRLLSLFLDECRKGAAELPLHADGSVHYRRLSKLVLGGRALGGRDVFLSQERGVRELIENYLSDSHLGAAHGTEFLGATDGLSLSTTSVYVNTDPVRYALLPWSVAKFRRAVRLIASGLPKQAPLLWKKAFAKSSTVHTPDDFRAWFIALLAAPCARGTSIANLPIRVLFALRREAVLLPPLGMLAGFVPRPFGGERFVIPEDCLTEWELSLKAVGQPLHSHLMRPVLINLGPVSRAQDFPGEEFVAAWDRLMRSFEKQQNIHSYLLSCALVLAKTVDNQVLAAGAASQPRISAQLETSSRLHGWRGRKATDPFSLPRHPVVRVWADHMRAYVQTKRWKAPRSSVHTMSRFLLFLESLKEPPTLDAPDLRARLFGPTAEWPQWAEEKKLTFTSVTKILGLLRRFFEWYSRQAPGFRSPLRPDDIPALQYRLKSNKVLVPRPLLDEVKQICRDLLQVALSEQSAVPQHLLNARAFETALIVHVGLPGRGLVPILAPQLPALLFTLLSLPLRPIQGRLLDSGEADEFIPVADAGSGSPQKRIQWIANPSLFARSKRREGFIRRIADTSVSEDFVGFWVNTNKTQAVGRLSGEDRGFEIPWQQEELIDVILRLRAWQERYNPLRGLYARDQLSEKILHPSDALRKRMPPYAFLFRHTRDTVVSTWHEPIAAKAFQHFFLLMLEELELRRRGTPDEVQLILKRDRSARPKKGVFSLHCLRVTGITALAEAGVPAPILAEFIAGHLTVLMTVYYQKFGPATVTQMMNEALSTARKGRAAAQGGQISAWDVRGMFVGEGPDALTSAADTSPGLWAFKLDGVCPNGQTRCGEGGARTKSTFYGPVPGGSRNCPLCRFWVTGPTFLAGQSIALNALLYKIRTKSEELVQLHQRLRVSSITPGERSALEHSIDTVEADVDVLVRSLQARYRLIQASIQLDRRSDADHPIALVTAGDSTALKTDMTRVSDLRFLEFVCRSVEVFPGLDCDAVTLRRNLLLDRVLDRDGFNALLFRLPTGAAIRAGNALGKVLAELVGDDGLDDLSAGLRSLRDLDMGRVRVALEDVLGEPVPLFPSGERSSDRAPQSALPPPPSSSDAS